MEQLAVFFFFCLQLGLAGCSIRVTVLLECVHYVLKVYTAHFLI